MADVTWQLYLPSDQPRRCSQPHCGIPGIMHRAKQSRAGRTRVWTWREKCAAVRGLVVREGRVCKVQREGVEA